MKSGTARAGIIVTALLLLAALVGGGVLLLRSSGNQVQEITVSTPEPGKDGMVFVDGAVANPGLYQGHNLDDLLKAAGGTTASADPSQIKVYVPQVGETPARVQSTKININTADAQLLDSLPGIGPVRARDIIDYRTQNGPFRTTRDITKVRGIGPATYEKLKDLIAVAD